MLPIKLSDMGMDNFKLFLQLFGVLLIICMLVYIKLSSKK